MKKLISILLLLLVTLGLLAACARQPQNGAPSEQKIEGTLSEIMDKIYAGAGNAEIGTDKTEVTKENAEYHLGATDIDFAEALASEPMISAVPHSIVLVKMGENADIEAAKTKIKENVDPRKWICVGVEPDQVIVDNIGNLIVLIMDTDAQAYHEAFKNLAK